MMSNEIRPIRGKLKCQKVFQSVFPVVYLAENVNCFEINLKYPPSIRDANSTKQFCDAIALQTILLYSITNIDTKFVKYKNDIGFALIFDIIVLL